MYGGILIMNDKERKNIKELFENFKSEYNMEEIDWGEMKGIEIW